MRIFVVIVMCICFNVYSINSKDVKITKAVEVQEKIVEGGVNSTNTRKMEFNFDKIRLVGIEAVVDSNIIVGIRLVYIPQGQPFHGVAIDPVVSEQMLGLCVKAQKQHGDISISKQVCGKGFILKGLKIYYGVAIDGIVPIFGSVDGKHRYEGKLIGKTHPMSVTISIPDNTIPSGIRVYFSIHPWHHRELIHRIGVFYY